MKKWVLENRGKLVLLGLVLVYLLYPVDLLEARDFDNLERLKIFRPRDKTFTIAYTHSVMLSQVTETYEIKNGDIVLLESTFRDYGAGLPSSTPYDFEIDEDKNFRIFNIKQVLNPLVYRTGATRANHRILVNEKEIDFRSFSEKREAVEFRALRKCRIYYILNLKG